MADIVQIRPGLKGQNPNLAGGLRSKSNTSNGAKNNIKDPPSIKNQAAPAKSVASNSKTKLSNLGFDNAKVERIKAAIQSGNYPINARRLAQNFANLEKLIS